MGQKSVLGKGLASLLPNAAVQVSVPAAGAVTAGEPTTVQQQEVGNRDRHPGISIAPIEEIVANQYQPRRDFKDETLEELAQSIRSNGVIQPLIVRKGFPGGYQLIAGERRLRAAKLAGLKQVPVVIRKSTDREVLELALIENIQREDLNCIDEALAYQQLHQDFSLTQEEVAIRVGKDRATVSNCLRLLKLPHTIIEDLKKGILSFGHGKALLSLDEKELCLRARTKIVEEKLSVRATEALVEEMKENWKTQPNGTQANSSMPVETPIKMRFSTLSQDLTRQWATRIELKGSERRGKIVVHFTSRQELERILVAMQCKDLWVNQ